MSSSAAAAAAQQAAERELFEVKTHLLLQQQQQQQADQLILDPNNLDGGPKPWYLRIWQFLLSNPKLRKGLVHVSLVILLAGYATAGASVRVTLHFTEIIELFSFPFFKISFSHHSVHQSRL